MYIYDDTYSMCNSMLTLPAWLIFLLSSIINISISRRKSSISESPSKKEQGCELGNFEKSPSKGLMGADGPWWTWCFKSFLYFHVSLILFDFGPLSLISIAASTRSIPAHSICAGKEEQEEVQLQVQCEKYSNESIHQTIRLRNNCMNLKVK